jgi:CheY-like chemotaxis protein
VGKGTTFELYLPLPKAESTEGQVSDVPGGRGERVLIVVEKAGKLNMLYDTLSLAGYTATMAQSGTEALQKIEAEGVPELLILDADMNLMTGVRTLAALLDLDYRGPVIMLVRPDQPLDRDGLPPIERIRFVEKPVSQPLLLRSVREELDATKSAT